MPPDNSLTQERIGRTRAQLYAVMPEGAERDSLLDQLSMAEHTINGCQDKMQALTELVAQRICAEIMDRIRLPGVIGRAVETHATECKGGRITLPPLPTVGKWGIPVDILKAALRSWQLAAVLVAAFVAPNAPTIIQTVINAFK